MPIINDDGRLVSFVENEPTNATITATNGKESIIPKTNIKRVYPITYVINKKNDSIQKEIRNLEEKKKKYDATETEIINNDISEMYQNKNRDSLLGIKKVWNLADEYGTSYY